MEPTNNTWEQPKDNLFEVKKIAGLLLSRWYWIVGGLILGLTIGYLGFIRYEDEIFVVNATFISKKFDESGSNRLAEIAETSQFRQRIEVHQELPLLKSQDRVEETLSRLDFGVSYFVEGRFKLTELYKNSPFVVSCDTASTQIPFGVRFHVICSSPNSFQLSVEKGNFKDKLADRDFHFGTYYTIEGWKFMVKQASSSFGESEDKFYFVINQPEKLLQIYRNKLNLNWAYNNSAIINTSIQGEIPEKEFDFLTAYLEVVIEKGLEEKNQYLSNTIDFIDDYIVQVKDTLFKHQKLMDEYKLDNRELINGSTYLFTKLNELDAQKTELLIENSYYDYIKDYINKKRAEEVFAPNLIGLDVDPLNELVKQYLEMKWQDKVQKNEYNEKNPLVNKQNEEYDLLEKNIFESISNLREANNVKIREIEHQVNFYYNSIGDFQLESREFSEVKRMQDLYSSVYNNLVTKRTEAFISKASTVSDYQIVTPPSYNEHQPIYPDKNNILLISVLLGLGLPIGVIYIAFIFNEKIISKEDLQKATSIPIMGNVSHSSEKGNLIVLDKPKSIVAESFRAIRANIRYFHPNGDNLTLLVTSFISGEGKTFCSTNLAFTYALAEKRTLLLGGDLRKPAFAANFNLTKEKGLSDYLIGMAEEKEILYNTGNPNLTIIPGGKIPPNPAELLMSSKMGELIISLKSKFDVIIIDTPPIGIVSDSMEMLKFSDVNLLIVRQGVTNRKSLQIVNELYQQKRLPHLSILFNDIDYQKYEYGYSAKGYGYGYGYGYGQGYYDDELKKRRWWKRKVHLD